MEYDVMFFEALGEEKHHLADILRQSVAEGSLPEGLRWYIGTETLQEYLAAHPGAVLPDILSTKTHSKLPDSWLHSGKKKSVISRSAGYDHFEHLAKDANIASLREYCVNSVAETAVKLLFCACGNLNQYTDFAAQFRRDGCVSFKELTGLKAAVFGVGRIGRRIYAMLEGLGLDVRGVDIRQDTLSEEYGGAVRFVSAEEAADSDIVVCAMNYTADPDSRFYNKGYFSGEYLAKFPQGAVFINVTRGEIAPEAPLWNLYRSGHFFGVGLDVFSGEAGLTKALRGLQEPENPDQTAAAEMIRAAQDRSENIYVQAHQGFNSDKAALCKAQETLRHLKYYYSHGCNGFAAQLPYYT